MPSWAALLGICEHCPRVQGYTGGGPGGPVYLHQRSGSTERCPEQGNCVEMTEKQSWSPADQAGPRSRRLRGWGGRFSTLDTNRWVGVSRTEEALWAEACFFIHHERVTLC